MLPADLNFDVSELDQELTSSGSGLSQRFDDYSLADGKVVPNSQPSVQQITPATTIQTKSSNPNVEKKKCSVLGRAAVVGRSCVDFNVGVKMSVLTWLWRCLVEQGVREDIEVVGPVGTRL
ncbi:hypothetical protein K432DRAFT_398065 [Lepidopterella palustris CBS 459.81]|uniref:Uncharacterized protein n=1 Tax=Lepidopterella palustris CBS 459.81 TaxID=1314670 RepID=A0A8E2DZP7_9PEZI|nr:hypothetical protein K432DRAFT_398065 [Lepidopterella palustris CBS 459.81]